ncbi:MAG: hypothetical protein ACRD88_22770, partial [Terriglobia bacterium]
MINSIRGQEAARIASRQPMSPVTAIEHNDGADTARTLRDGGCAILYLPVADREVSARWFEPAWWEAQGRAVQAETGRGATWFVGAPGAQWVLR